MSSYSMNRKCYRCDNELDTEHAMQQGERFCNHCKKHIKEIFDTSVRDRLIDDLISIKAHELRTKF